MSEDSFLREVEDELRSDKLRQFWRRFAPFVIGAAVLIVLLVAGNEAWTWWRSSQAAQASERFYAAQALAESGDRDAALAAFRDIAADGPGGYAALARFREAGLLAGTGENEAALALYDTLASNAPDPSLRELALVLGAYLLVDSGAVDAVQTRVAGVVDSDTTLALAAREALGLTQYAAGDLEAARASFEALAAEAGPNQDLQGRAVVYLEVLASESGQALTGPSQSSLEDLGIEGVGLEGIGADLLEQDDAATGPVPTLPEGAAETPEPQPEAPAAIAPETPAALAPEAPAALDPAPAAQ